jgi:hypothetical protein
MTVTLKFNNFFPPNFSDKKTMFLSKKKCKRKKMFFFSKKNKNAPLYGQMSDRG